VNKHATQLLVPGAARIISGIKMPLRVLHVINSLGLGGAQVCLKYLAENASDAVKILVYPLRANKIVMPIDAAVIKLPFRHYDPRKFFAILRLCREHQIDIIHAHLHKSIIGALLATYFRDVRVVLHEHGPIFRSGPQYGLYRFLLRRLHQRAGRVIAVSQATAQRLIQKAKIDPRRISIIPNAVDLDKFACRSELRDHARAQLGAGPDDIVLGFVGRLHYVKGVDVLLEAAALLLEKSPRYLLALIGAGPQRSALQTQAQQLGIAARVRFLGFRSDIPEIIPAFDIGLVPSRQEPFGMVALEFMRAKIPLVASGVDGLAEIVTHEQTALVPADNTPRQTADCVERLTHDKELARKLTEAAFQVSERYGVAQYVKTIENIYAELLSKEMPFCEKKQSNG